MSHGLGREVLCPGEGLTHQLEPEGADALLALGMMGPGLWDLLWGSEPQACAVETRGLCVCPWGQCRSHSEITRHHDSDLPRTALPLLGG